MAAAYAAAPATAPAPIAALDVRTLDCRTMLSLSGAAFAVAPGPIPLAVAEEPASPARPDPARMGIIGLIRLISVLVLSLGLS